MKTMIARVASLFSIAVLSALVGCAAKSSGSSSSSTAAISGGGDEASAPLCDSGALSSSRLQPGASGGPDAHAQVACTTGFALCRVDPNGDDNDVCSDRDDCYACVAPAVVDAGTTTTTSECESYGDFCFATEADCQQIHGETDGRSCDGAAAGMTICCQAP